MKTNIPLDIAMLILGMFLYGVRNVAAKWMVMMVWKVVKKFLIKTEKDMALYLHHRNKAYNKRHRH